MKSITGVICLFLCVSKTLLLISRLVAIFFQALHVAATAEPEDLEIQHLSTLLQTVSPNNETKNTKIKEQIVGMFKKMDTAFTEDDTSLDNSKRILKRIEFCRKALIYIMDNVRGEKGDEECKHCVKDPDATKLTQLFDDLGPEVWQKIDKATAELLVNATASLKGLKDELTIIAYKKKLYCNAERMNLVSLQ